MQQFGLAAQLLLPPRELLLGPLIDGSRLFLRGCDPCLGFLSGSALGLLRLSQSLGANSGRSARSASSRSADSL
jgi:hypothetical protein